MRTVKNHPVKLILNLIVWVGMGFFGIFFGDVGKEVYALECGINIDPANPGGFPTPTSIGGVGWVRLEFKDCTVSNDITGNAKLKNTLATYKSLLGSYKSAGLKTLLIIDYASFANAQSDVPGFGERAGVIASYLGSSVDAYEIWNEPDIGQGGSLSPEEFSNILSSAATKIGGGAYIVSGGLAGGQASYLSATLAAMGVNSGLIDAVGLHPYGKVPGAGLCAIGNTGDLGSYINEHARASGGKPIWITEIGLDTTDEAKQATYLDCFYKSAKSMAAVKNVIWFGWSDAMVTPFGLMRSNMSRKPAGDKFNLACGASISTIGSNQTSVSVQADPGFSCAVTPGEGWGGRGGGTTSGIDEEGPLCTVGSSKIKLKGTLKSTRLFMTDPLDPDKLIRLQDQSSSGPLPRETNVLNNQKVAGAVVAIYKSQKIADPPNLPAGMRMVNFTGKKNGNIVGKLLDVVTMPDGLFEIESTVTCEEIWDGTKDGWKQYLAILCPDNPDGGTGRLMLKDLYSFHLRPGVTDAVLDLRDINIDCDSDTGVHGRFSAPNDLNYVFRNKDTFLACSGSTTLSSQIPSTNEAHATGDHRLQSNDEHGVGTDHGSTIFDWIKEQIRKLLLDIFYNGLDTTPFNGRTEGRISLQRVMCDMRKIYGTTPGFFRGVKESYLDIPKYYSKGAPADVETYNNLEEKQEPFKCEMIRRSSATLGEKGYEDFNTQTSGGFFNNLGIPFGGLIIRLSGEIDPYLSGDAARYLAANKSIEPGKGLVVCLDEARGEHYLGEFMPMDGYCGDLDSSGKINGGEMPCPEYFTCGDYNGDNKVTTSDGERDCSKVRVQNDDLKGYGREGYYKFDIRYFPQFALDVKYTKTLGYEQNTRIFENNDDKSDWCGRGVYDGGWFNKNEDPSGVSRPDTRPECHGNGETSQAFLGQLSVKRPSTINGVSFFTTLHTLSADKDAMYPHSMVLSTPQFVNSPDSAAIVKESVNLAANTAQTKDTGGLSRIGSLDSLCTCSLVEDGTNSADSGLGNCFHDAQIDGVAPDPRQPLNAYDSTQDYKLPGEGGNYGVFNENSQPNKVAADYDWTEIKASEFVERGVKPVRDNGEAETHYSQYVAASVIESVVRAAHNIYELIQCSALGLGGDYNNEASVNCTRMVNMIGNATTWTPRKPKADFMKNWYVVGEVMTAPFTLLPDIDAVCEEDSSYTKSYEFNSALSDSPDSKGKESYEGESFENSLAYLVNSAKPPSFDGGYTSTCRIVPGWQVTQSAKGLFTIDCLKNGTNCWVGGSVASEEWTGGSTLIMPFSPQSNSLSGSLVSGSQWVHGLSAYDSLRIGVGQGGVIYKENGGSWNTSTPLTDFIGNPYRRFLYDVAGTPGKGYIATGTGHVFFSANGTNWNDIGKKDVPNVRVGCEDPDYPYGCVATNSCWTPALISSGTVCDNDPATALPLCPDPTCWKWADSSIWGVDCTDQGDCIIAGQTKPKAWRSLGTSNLGNPDSWIREELSGVTGGHAMNVSFPGPDTAYIVGGSDNDRDARGGFILKSVNKGDTWTSMGLPAGSDSGLKGIDCFDSSHCAAVGNNGTILVLEGETWSEKWKDSQEIIDAKAEGVRFWDVAYPSEGIIVAVGFKPASPGSDQVTGVIYSLGEVLDCNEPTAPMCPNQTTPSCIFNSSGGFVWNNINTKSCGGTIDDPGQIPAPSYTNVTGTILFRDPVTYGNEDYVLNSCNVANTVPNPPRSCGGVMNGIPVIEVRYGGGQYIFKVDKDSFANCPKPGYFTVGELNYNISVPTGSQVSLRVADNLPVCGEVNPCISDSGFRGGYWDGITEDWFTAESGSCYNAVAWSQVPTKQESGGAIHTSTNSCSYTEVCKRDGCETSGGVPSLAVSGNCVAKSRNLPIGFRPCSEFPL